MNIFTKLCLPIMPTKATCMDSLLHILKGVLHVTQARQNHSSMTIFINCVYALNENKHTKFNLLASFKAEI